MLVAQSLPVLLSVSLAFLLCLSKCSQFAVPLGFERVRYQPVLGLNAHIATASQVRFILGSFDLLQTQPVSLGESGLQFLLNGECDLKRYWTDRFDQ